MHERFWSKVEKTPTCWLWTGKLNNAGYGRFTSNGRSQRAHRVAYELTVGPIPEGLTIDHLCRNRACVRPDHLEPVSVGENLLRGEGICAQNSRKWVCVRGHEYTPENTRREGKGGLYRRCRTCRTISRRERRKALQAQWGLPGWGAKGSR